MANTLVFANSSAVQARVEFQAFSLARYVISTEPANTPDHAIRLKLAYAVMNGLSMIQLAKVVLTNPSIIAASPTEVAFLSVVADADILSELNSSWTMIATAMFGNLP